MTNETEVTVETKNEHCRHWPARSCCQCGAKTGDSPECADAAAMRAMARAQSGATRRKLTRKPTP